MIVATDPAEPISVEPFEAGAANPEPVSIRHLQVLDSDAQWSAPALGSRIRGVTHDTADAGFRGKSCLSPDIQILQRDGSVKPSLCEEHDPETEEELTRRYLAEAGTIPRRLPSPTEYMRTINPLGLADRWEREDQASEVRRARLGRRMSRITRRQDARRNTRRPRCRLKRKVARLEGWHRRVVHQSRAEWERYEQFWTTLVEELDQLRTPQGGLPVWVRQLEERLWRIAYQSETTQGSLTRTHQHHSDPSLTNPKSRDKKPHSPKQSRRSPAKSKQPVMRRSLATG